MKGAEDMRDDQEQNTDDKAPTIGKEGPCGFSCGDCPRKGDCAVLAEAGELNVNGDRGEEL